jgi:lipopolysaccharide transport system ATP-binding protein
MMSSNAIELRDVSKKFIIHHEKRTTLYEHIIGLLKKGKNYERLNVLENVSFTIKQGEMIGIIGRNGTGKTTLLRLIASIFKPDKGEIITNGKLIPLLELGTGFHPDLTATDNIIMYGMILGFTKDQISSKVNDILKFAELEKFADVQIKHFSSGMYSRLAFATAMEVDPDIILVDEVLSVGDMPFQKKSFDAFMSFRKKGKTILYVSQNLDSVKELCDRAILLHNGRLEKIGKPQEVIDRFFELLDNEKTSQ